jgi:hypothetical protein
MYIHIGMPKTGSSAIQAFLSLNYNVLKKSGFLFPNPPNPNYGQAYQTTSGNADSIATLIRENNITKIKDNISKIIQDSDSFNCENIIFSTEFFFQILAMYPERFLDIFEDYEYKIICYIRRQDTLFSSAYNQSVKNHDLKSKTLPSELIEKMDFCKILKNSLNYIDVRRMLIRPYEKKQFYLGNIFEDFLNSIGLKLTDEYIFPEKIVNPSLDFDTLEFRRILNILEIDKTNTIKKYVINSFLAKYTVDNSNGFPFQDHNIYSNKERIEIINKYEKENQEIARIFLNRQDGKLFYDELPKDDKSSILKKEFTNEKAIDICKFIFKEKYNNSIETQLIQILEKVKTNKIFNYDN